MKTTRNPASWTLWSIVGLVGLLLVLGVATDTAGNAAAAPNDGEAEIITPDPTTPTPTPRGPFNDVVAPSILDNPVAEKLTPEPTATAMATAEPTATAMATAEPTATSTESTDPTTTTTTEPTATNIANPTSTAVPTRPSTQAQPTPTAQADAASLTLIVHACTPNYDPFDDIADPAEDCPEKIDSLTFQLRGDETNATRTSGDDGEGMARFDNLAPGPYRLVGPSPSAGSIAFVHDCESDLRTVDAGVFFPQAMVDPNGTVGIRLGAEENLQCSWYEISASDTATVAVTLRWCASATVNAATCDLYRGGLEMSLRPVDGGEGTNARTDDTGQASLRAPSGIYALEQEGGRAWCFADSDAFDADGNLVIEDVEMVEVAIYNCGEQP